jgi:hypothetical protein
MDLRDQHIVLGLSGGIACYKSAELCRALIKEGATVQVVMTAAAEQFIAGFAQQGNGVLRLLQALAQGGHGLDARAADAMLAALEPTISSIEEQHL